MPPDGAALDAALVAYLRGDAALVALLPDGVFLDEAPQNSTRFVLVSVVAAVDEATFDGRGFETVTYRVTAVGLNRAIEGGALGDAAARIDAILDGAQVTAAGYPAPASVARVGRIRAPLESDFDDRSQTWQERGGVYEVHAPN